MAAPRTVKTYDLDGSTRDFEIPFEYLARKFVQVTLIGQDRRTLILNTDYRFTQRTVITTTVAFGPADGYERIELRRFTSATERLVNFSDGSILRAYDLNISQIQSLHIAEEGRDVATDTIGVNNDGDLDARGRRIVNLADATEDHHAVTLRQEKAWAESTLNSSIKAEAQADKAEVQANGAFREATRAATAAQSSLDYSNHARQWASHPENVVVTGGLYSALHYSRKAAADAATVAGQIAAAAASAAAARASEVNARASEVNAKNSETAAKAAEVNAEQWAQASRADAANVTYTGPAGEARKVQDLSGTGGATLLGTRSGKTIQAELDRIATIASPGPNRPVMKYGSATAWKFLTRHATLNGFRWGGNVTNPYGRTLPIPPSFEASLVGTGLGAESTHVKENWYAAFACANPGDTVATVKCMPFVRVKAVNGLVLTLGAAGERVGATPADKSYNWTAAHNLNGCDILICNQGMGTLQMHTVKSTGNREGTITVNSATNIAVGSFLLIAPPGFTEYGYLGSVYMDTQEIRNFYDDGSEVQQYGVAHLDVTSGGISTPVAVNMAGYICPLAVASLIEVSNSGFGSGGGTYREDYGGDSAHFQHGRYTEGTFTTAIFNARVVHSYLYQVFYIKTAGTKQPTRRQILGRGYVER